MTFSEVFGAIPMIMILAPPYMTGLPIGTNSPVYFPVIIGVDIKRRVQSEKENIGFQSFSEYIFSIL